MELEMLGGKLLQPSAAKLTESLANSIKKLGYEFEWIKEPSDFDKAEVRKFATSLYRG
jgi:hypothetical protein